jgi:curved DNA-binding protein CbpA
VSPDAPDEVIRAAYRVLAAKHHPDRNPGDREAELKLKRLNAAFAVLGDQEKRELYDELTRGAEASDPPPEESSSAPAQPMRPRAAEGAHAAGLIRSAIVTSVPCHRHTRRQ